IETPPLTYGYVPSSTRQTSAPALLRWTSAGAISELRSDGPRRPAFAALADLVQHQRGGQRSIRIATGRGPPQQRDRLRVPAPRESVERTAPLLLVTTIQRVARRERAREPADRGRRQRRTPAGPPGRRERDRALPDR